MYTISFNSHFAKAITYNVQNNNNSDVDTGSRDRGDDTGILGNGLGCRGGVYFVLFEQL